MVNNEIRYHPIGVIHSPFKEPEEAPMQPSAARTTRGVLELYPEYIAGLKGVEKLTHIQIIFHLHKSSTWSLTPIPFFDDKPHGIFSIRSPHRPNPIGVSVVNVVKVDGNMVHFQGVDMIDGTPVLDIKPHIQDSDE